MKRQEVTFDVTGTVNQVVEFYDDQYDVNDIIAGTVLTTIGSEGKLIAIEDGGFKEVGKVLSQEVVSDTEYSFDDMAQPGQKRGWVFCEEGTYNEIGFAEPHECKNAEEAYESFSKECAEHFDVYFMDINGGLNPCTAESTPDDFD